MMVSSVHASASASASTRKSVVDRHPDRIDVEVVGRLGERGMGALGQPPRRAGDARAPGPDVTGGLHGLQQALGAARGEIALDRRPPGAGVVGAEQRAVLRTMSCCMVPMLGKASTLRPFSAL